MEMRLSLVIPAKNEGGNLKWMKSPLKAIMNTDFELILIDDGSTDNTQQIIQDITAEISSKGGNATVLNNLKSIGKTKSLQKGFKQAKGEFVGYMDADYQVDPLEIFNLLDKLDEGYDLVNGWRVHRFMGDSWMKKLQSDVYNWIVRQVTGSKLHDHNCPFKIFKKECVDAVDFSVEGYQTYLVCMIQKAGYKTAEVPVSWYKRMYGESKFFGPGRLKRGFKHLIQLKRDGKV